MKYFPESYHKSVDVHGVQVPVRRGIRFVTININNTVQGWACRPELSSVDEGIWLSSDCTPVRLGYAEMEYGESCNLVFEVKD